MLAMLSWRRHIKRNVSKSTQIRTHPQKQMKHLRKWMLPWLVFQTQLNGDSTIKWGMLIHFSKESPRGILAGDVAPTSREAALVTLILYHLKTSSTLCSSGSSPSAASSNVNNPRGSSRDSRGGRVVRSKKQTWVLSLGKCSQCFSSFSSLFSQVRSLVASFRMAHTTITACNEPITMSSSWSATDWVKSISFRYRPWETSVTTKDWSNSWIIKWKRTH